MDTVIANVTDLGGTISDSAAQTIAYAFLVVAAVSIGLLAISSRKIDEQKKEEAISQGQRFSESFPPDSLLTPTGIKLRRFGLVGIGILILGFVVTKIITGESL